MANLIRDKHNRRNNQHVRYDKNGARVRRPRPGFQGIPKLGRKPGPKRIIRNARKLQVVLPASDVAVLRERSKSIGETLSAMARHVLHGALTDQSIHIDRDYWQRTLRALRACGDLYRERQALFGDADPGQEVLRSCAMLYSDFSVLGYTISA